MEKLCVFCEHLDFEDGGYEDYPDPAAFSCRKNHFAASIEPIYDVEGIRRIIKQAENCPDYTPPEIKSV